MRKARFDQIYQEGKRVKGDLCRLIALPGEGQIGFATPRKLGNTPRRNRLKRRFRAAVLQMTCPSHLDLVVSIGANADRSSFGAIREDLQKALEKLIERWANESESS